MPAIDDLFRDGASGAPAVGEQGEGETICFTFLG